MKPKRKTNRKLTLKSHELVPTSEKNLFRLVDLNGDWTHYYLKREKQYIPAVNHIIKIGFPKGERFLSYLLNTTKEEAKRKLESAGEEGTRTHQAIRDLIDGRTVGLHTKYLNEQGRLEILNNDEWQNLIAFSEWVAKYKPRLSFHERSLATSLVPDGYAGTPDFYGSIEIPEGDRCVSKEFWGKRITVLLDWKTSSGIWDEYKLQTAAYSSMLDEMGWTGVVRVGTNHKCGYEMELWTPEETKNHFRLFANAHSNYRFITKGNDIPTIRTLPGEFKIKITKEK